MKRKEAVLFSFVLLFFFSVNSQAQHLWSGILNQSRAIDWTSAGIPGGLPDSSWTQCGSTIAAYTGTADTINNAIAACGNGNNGQNQYVLLGPGTFNLSSAIAFNSKGNFVLRGSGANSTFVIFGSSANNSCFGLNAAVCMNSTDSTYANQPPGTIYNWTGGYSQGATQITLSSVAGINLNGGSLLMLDQCEDGYTGTPCSGSAVDTGNYYNCADGYSAGNGCSADGPDGENRPHRSQIEIVTATAINQGGCGATCVTITPPLKAPNWRSGQSPQVWIIKPLQNAGLENMSIDFTAAPPQAGITMYTCNGCWVSGVRSIDPFEWHMRVFQSTHVVIQNNYFMGPMRYSDPYGIAFEMAGSQLVVNNIFQQIRCPIVFDGPDSGSVIAYNFAVDDYNASDHTYFFPAFWNHSGGIAYDLWEGNVSGGFTNDSLHGTHEMETNFRNFYTGWQTGNTQDINPYGQWYGSRYDNVMGNVLGTSGIHTGYQSTAGNAGQNTIYLIGASNGASGIPVDPLGAQTILRWGNYDVITGVRFCGNSSDTGWTTTCSSTSEVPSGISPYANSVPTLGDTGIGQNPMPASFYYSSQPSWFGSHVWPPIGPDVSNGSIGVCSGGTYDKNPASSSSQCTGGSFVTGWGGHANMIPAMDCYLNTMGGTPSGTGSVLTFDPTACYGSDPPPNPPTGLTAVVQ
jgi:hypothetical protein